MAKKRLLEWGFQRRGFVTVDDEATKGGRIGVDILNADGTLFDPTTEVTRIIEEVINSDPPIIPPSTTSTIWRFILEIPANILSLAALAGIGFATRINAAGDWANRVITGATGRITVVSGDGIGVNVGLTLNSGGAVEFNLSEFVTLNAGGNVDLNSGSIVEFNIGGDVDLNALTVGDPVIDLDLLADSGIGTSPLRLFTRDAWGRLSGTKAAISTDLPNPLVVNKNSAYTITVLDEVILADASSAGFTLTLPTAVGIKGKQFSIKKIDNSFNFVTVDGDGSETIDDDVTMDIVLQYDTMKIISDNANWNII